MADTELFDPERVQRVHQATIDSIQTQATLPESPCDQDGRLCAGALQVRAAILSVCSALDASAFEDRLMASRDTEEIVRAALEIGFPVQLVKDAILLNDSTNESQRVARMVEYFDQPIAPR